MIPVLFNVRNTSAVFYFGTGYMEQIHEFEREAHSFWLSYIFLELFPLSMSFSALTVTPGITLLLFFECTKILYIYHPEKTSHLVNTNTFFSKYLNEVHIIGSFHHRSFIIYIYIFPVFICRPFETVMLTWCHQHVLFYLRILFSLLTSQIL